MKLIAVFLIIISVLQKLTNSKVNDDLKTNGIWRKLNSTDGTVPKNAVLGGSDKHGDLYVIKASYNNEEIAGKYSPSLHSAYIPHNGQEVKVLNFDILEHTNYIWSGQHKINPNPKIPGGKDKNGKTIYICKAKHKIYWIPGKLIEKSCYVSYGGKEIRKSKWSVLKRGA